MLRTPRRGWVFPTALAALVAAAVWATSPCVANAKPFLPEEDPPFENGDPTADDQPSPTPKQSRRAAAMGQRAGETDVIHPGASSWIRDRVIWLAMAHAFIRIRIW